MTEKEFKKYKQLMCQKGQKNRKYWLSYTYNQYLKDTKKMERINNEVEKYKSKLRCEN
jgi:hypothetical protein